MGSILQAPAARRIGALILVLSSSLIAEFAQPAALGAGQTPAISGGQQPVPFRSDIDYVQVDVRVLDREGRFVRDLRPDEFELYEDGVRQKVAAFTLVDLPPPAPRPATAAVDAPPVEPDVQANDAASSGRVYVILLDDLHVAPLRSGRVRQLARDFIERFVGPNDLAAVVHTSGQASQEFTTNRRLLLRAVDAFAGRKLRSSVLERLAEYERRRDERTRADMRLNRVQDPLDVQRADQARRMLRTLTNLGDLLSQAQGRRKAMVLISEGVDYDLQQGVAQTSSGLTTFTSPHAPEVLRELRRTIGAAARANINIYAIDPRGLVGPGDELIEVGSFPENPHFGLTPQAFQDELRRAQDSLRTLSGETGGIASVSSNEFNTAFDRIVDENSTYYMLGYQSSDSRRDGRYRRIEVRVKRPDTRVRARSGYSAGPLPTTDPGLLTAAAEPSPAVRGALNAPLPMTALPLRIFAAPFKGEKDASVSVGIELDGRNFQFEQKDGLYTDRLDVGLVALDEQAKFKAGDRQTIALRLKPDTHKAVLAHGLRVLFRLNLPPGRYQLRAAAHETGGNRTGSVFYDMEIPDFSRAPIALSGLVLTAAQASRMPTVRPDPVFASALPSPPSGARMFDRGETLLVIFEAYRAAGVTAGAVDVVTSVRGADGQVRFRAQEPVSDERMREGEGRFGYAVRIPLADLPPGPYTLRVEASARVSPGSAAVREVPFGVAAPAAAAR